MKVTCLLAALLGVASAAPQLHQAPVDTGFFNAPAAAPAAATAAATAPGAGTGRMIPGAAGLPGFGITGNPYGEKFYGMGLNNPLSLWPNPIEIHQAQQITRMFPNTLARVDPDGEVAITNKFGQEIDIEDMLFL